MERRDHEAGSCHGSAETKLRGAHERTVTSGDYRSVDSLLATRSIGDAVANACRVSLMHLRSVVSAKPQQPQPHATTASSTSRAETRHRVRRRASARALRDMPDEMRAALQPLRRTPRVAPVRRQTSGFLRAAAPSWSRGHTAKATAPDCLLTPLGKPSSSGTFGQSISYACWQRCRGDGGIWPELTGNGIVMQLRLAHVRSH